MRQWVPFPVADVFGFFANPRNLPKLMPHWQKARIEEARLRAPSGAIAQEGEPASKFAGSGSLLRISFRPLPLSPARAHWNARIVEFVWEDHFCDEQESGPFAYWRHCHRVREETRNGIQGTSVTDEVAFQFPFGLAGEIAYRMGGAWQVRALFRYRQKQLLRLLEAGARN